MNWAVLSSTDSFTDTFHMRTTQSDSETSSDGWKIGNTGRKSTNSGGDGLMGIFVGSTMLIPSMVANHRRPSDIRKLAGCPDVH